MHNGRNVCIIVAAPGENVRDMLQVCDRVEVSGGLLAPETAIQVAADRRVLAVPGELTDMVHVVGNMCECDPLVVFRTACPARVEHPIIECHTNYAITGNDCVDLLVIELALVRD